MRIWADVYSAANVKLGSVNNIKSARVTTALDGAGTWTMAFSATDANALSLLQEERRVRLFVQVDGKTRLMGGGVIQEPVVSGDATASVSGVDDLVALTRRSVLLGRKYDNQPIATIASDLIGLVPGWSILVTATGNQSVRLDGASVLKALIRVANEAGLHLRLGEVLNTAEMGAFGDNSGMTALKPQTITSELQGRDDIVLIDKIQRTTSSKDLVNRVFPIGAGEGEAALTLKNSSYIVPSLTGPDGKTIYYLDDQDSIDTYGRIERFATFKEIVPLDNTATAKERAADMLYQAAQQWLQRNAQPLIGYSLTVKKMAKRLRPGDKVHVQYKGWSQQPSGQPDVWLNVDELMWVMKVTENVSEGGSSVQLDVSTIDRYEQDVGEIVVNALEAIQVRNISVQTYPAPFIYGGYDTIQGLNFVGGSSGYNAIKNAVYVLRIDDSFTDVTRVKLNFKTTPLFATVRQTVSGTTWTHIWQVVPGGNYPTYLRLEINGDDVTDDLGGPWGGAQNTAGSAVDVTVDITDYILAAPNLYQGHTISLSCGYYTAETRVDSSELSNVNSQASNGVVFFTITGQAIGQAK